ncbi:ribokinase-like isoform X2 [Dreissena polymorpha]|nr:ribokinase-like isoform X2 [Dreissena polymorpha]
MGFGGKGANQCAMTAKLGAKTAMVAKVGYDTFGEGFLKKFRELGVDTGHCSSTSEAMTGAAPICVDETGQNSVVIVPGANLLLSEADLEAAEEVISKSKVIICQLEIDPKVTLSALKMARKHKVMTILNPAPAVHLEADFLTNTDVFCPNETETEILTGISIRTVEEAKAASEEMLRRGCNNVIITLGGLGCVVAQAGFSEVVHVSAPSVTVVDSTGAGDAFIGSLAYFLSVAPGLGLVESARRAVQIASISVQHPGTMASFPTRSELPDTLLQETSS